MAQEIEIEYSVLLTKKEFDHLMASLPFPNKPETQINYYFETKDSSLKRNSCALRIREKAGNYKLTMKEPHTFGLLETHDALTKQEAFSWIHGNIIAKEHTMKQLKRKGISPDNLIYYGSLTTERREFKYKEVLLVLDFSTFNDHFDYELELEATNQAVGLQTFHSLLEEYGIQRKSTPNKIQRFFSTLPK